MRARTEAKVYTAPVSAPLAILPLAIVAYMFYWVMVVVLVIILVGLVIGLLTGRVRIAKVPKAPPVNYSQGRYSNRR